MPGIPAEIYSLIAQDDPVAALLLSGVNRQSKAEITRRLGEWLLTRYLPTLVVPTWYAPNELQPRYYQLLVHKFFTPGVPLEMVVEKPHLSALLGDLLRQMGTRNFDEDIEQYTRTVLLLMGGHQICATASARVHVLGIIGEWKVCTESRIQRFSQDTWDYIVELRKRQLLVLLEQTLTTVFVIEAGAVISAGYDCIAYQRLFRQEDFTKWRLTNA